MNTTHTDHAMQQAQLFRLLMHPTRIAILNILRHGEECVCHLEAHLGQRQAYISQQLAVLRNAQLIADRRDGLNIFYHIVRPEVITLLDAAAAMVDMPNHALMSIAHCPCPKCTIVHTKEKYHAAVGENAI